MEEAVVRGLIILVLAFAALISADTVLAKSPSQGERPPQPFFQDFFSGQATLQGNPAPAGTQLLACVDNCITGFQSDPIEVEAQGVYANLEVNPSDESLIGRKVAFYLINEFGRIRAAETRNFVGIFDFYTVDLTFNEPLPSPTPTPTLTPRPTLTPTAILPVPGDPGVTAIPRLALIIGAGAVVLGSGLLLLARRKTAS